MIAAFRAFTPAVETPGAVTFVVPQAPGSPMLNRVVGLGSERAARPEELDEAIAAYPPGSSFYVAVVPGARPPELGQWLSARGLEPGWGWMLFRRGVEAPPPARTSLRLVEVDSDESAAAFGRIVRTTYALPEATEHVFARAPGSGWSCWLALDGDEPAAAAALYAAEGVGYLGMAGTLAEHRGKGAQGALLATRIGRAAQVGCDTVVAETGERRDDRPSNSYRNILRAGFEEVAVTANWLGRA